MQSGERLQLSPNDFVLLNGRPPEQKMDTPGLFRLCLKLKNGKVFLVDAARNPPYIQEPILQMKLHELDCDYPGVTSLLPGFEVQCNPEMTDEQCVRYDSLSDPTFSMSVLRSEIAKVKAAVHVASAKPAAEAKDKMAVRVASAKPAAEATDKTALREHILQVDHTLHGTFVVLNGRPPQQKMGGGPGLIRLRLNLKNGKVFLADEAGSSHEPILQMNLHELGCDYPGVTSLLPGFEVQCNPDMTDDKWVRYESLSDPEFYMFVPRGEIAKLKAAVLVAFPDLQKKPSAEATDEMALRIHLLEVEHKLHGKSLALTAIATIILQDAERNGASWQGVPLTADQTARVAKLLEGGGGSAGGAASSHSD